MRLRPIIGWSSPLSCGVTLLITRVERAQPTPHRLRHQPALAAVEEDGEDEPLVHTLLRCERHRPRAKDKGTEGAEGLARRRDAAVDISRV